MLLRALRVRTSRKSVERGCFVIRQIQIFVIALTLLVVGYGDVVKSAAEKPKLIRVGVYIRTGYQPCLEELTPMADRLGRANPGYEFVLVPLATREDAYVHLERKEIDFLLADSAIYACTEVRFGTSALCGMLNGSSPDYTGSLIRKADRSDLTDLQDLRSKRMSAVKPWSLSGWLMQWNVLEEQKIDPLDDLTVQFEGTHLDVIQAVLDGTADAGAIGTDILRAQIESGAVDPKSLWIFDRKGKAVPLTSDSLVSTEAYPFLVFAKSATTTDEFAQKVLKDLMFFEDKPTVPTDRIKWTVPQNYEKVRDLLRKLMGADYAYTTKMIHKESGFLTVTVELIIVTCIALVLCVFLFVAWLRAKGRENIAQERLRIIRSELEEVRASKNLIETILSRVKCGMDIVDEKNEIIYVTPGLEHHYGPWHGKKCHEYYVGSSTPCEFCRKRDASEHRKPKESNKNYSPVTYQEDPHPIGNFCMQDNLGKLLQVPFYDENGRWLYARVHFPPEVLEEASHEKTVASSHHE